jgi:hypothetical protein
MLVLSFTQVSQLGKGAHEQVNTSNLIMSVKVLAVKVFLEHIFGYKIEIFATQGTIACKHMNSIFCFMWISHEVSEIVWL